MKKRLRNFNVTFVKFLRTPFSTTKAAFRWGFIVKIVNDENRLLFLQKFIS